MSHTNKNVAEWLWELSKLGCFDANISTTDLREPVMNHIHSTFKEDNMLIAGA